MEKKKQKKSGSEELSDVVSIKATVPYHLLSAFDDEFKRHGYSTRSEAVREAMRKLLEIWTGRRY